MINKKTKIIATLGPASSSKDVLRELIKAGVNLFRFNFSHADYEDVLKKMEILDELEKELGVYIGRIADLQGPKIRLGKLEGRVTFSRGEEVYLLNCDYSDKRNELPLPFAPFFETVAPGDVLYINDGILKLKVLEVDKGKKVKCITETNGTVSSHKGVNLPDTPLKTSALTPKDLADLEFIKAQSFSYVALSFVRYPSDIQELKQIISGTKLGVIAKIEKKEALENIKEIINISDGIMVARGDLGIEVSMEKLPHWQKHIIKLGRFYSKPVIIATQMLESMIENAIPTRAEATDVANAIYDGADALMLSGETAIGNYPVEAVEWMSRIIVNSEQELSFERIFNWKDLSIEEAVSRAAFISARSVNADYIVATTLSGRTAMLASKLHSPFPVVAFSPDIQALRKTALFWGVIPLLGNEVGSVDELVMEVKRRLKEKFPQERKVIVITGGFPFIEHTETNFLLVEKC